MAFQFADSYLCKFMSRKLFVITGPTAAGKTDEATRLAQELACPILSADSRQVYKELNIGVARPTEEQLATVQHYFIAHISIHEPYNAGRYAMEGRHLINALFEQHEHLVICGGTGLYIQALLQGLDRLPGRNDELRAELDKKLAERGIESLQAELKSLDIERYQLIDIQNPQRLIRAIEILKTPLGDEPELPGFKHHFETEIIKILPDREVLYQRINQRVHQMMKDGLEEEAKNLAAFKNLNALQSVGYNEWWPYFRGECTKAEVMDKIQQHTRNYAKRQMTWIRHKM